MSNAQRKSLLPYGGHTSRTAWWLAYLGFLFAIVCANFCASVAQPAEKTVRLGFVDIASQARPFPAVDEFWKRIHELGWSEGGNLVVERRFAEGHVDRLPGLMADVVDRKIDVLVTWGTPAAIAAKKATTTIPIVAATMGDPIGTGLATSLAHPGGNLTGLSLQWGEGVTGKWLELLQDVIPKLATVAVIHNPDSALAQRMMRELIREAPSRGLKLQPLEVRDPRVLESVFAQARRHAEAILVLPDPLVGEHRARVVALAAKHRLPDMYAMLEDAEAGGLMAYGVDHKAVFRRAAEYVDKILRGTKPEDLPIEQPSQFVLALNIRTARALRLAIPQSILLRANEVIQ
jgi:ABC-type uncharacterized transport system substrate-binding protein